MKSEHILSPLEESTDYIVGEYTVEKFREQFQHASKTPVYANLAVARNYCGRAR